MEKSDIINYLIGQNGYGTYLEIGVDDEFRLYSKVECSEKWHFKDRFPETEQKFDIIYIGGFRDEERIRSDVSAALRHLNPKGKAVVGDCFPASCGRHGEKTVADGKSESWKAVCMLGCIGADYSTVYSDGGCCVIERPVGEVGCLPPCPLVYSDIEENPHGLLHVVTEERFVGKYDRSAKTVIVGKAASGKDFTKKLLTLHNRRNTYGVFHTTRPRRGSEKEGDDYFFVDDGQFACMERGGAFVVRGEYNGWHYGLTWSQWHRANVFVFTPEYINSLDAGERSKCSVIYLNTPESVRKARLEARCDADTVERRLSADDSQFEGFTDYDVMIDNLIYNENGKKEKD